MMRKADRERDREERRGERRREREGRGPREDSDETETTEE
jgi:hypothetical protein